MKFGFERALEDDAVGVHQGQARGGAQEGDGGALGDFDANVIGQRALDGDLRHPGNRFECLAASFERNAQDALAEIGGEALA